MDNNNTEQSVYITDENYSPEPRHQTQYGDQKVILETNKKLFFSKIVKCQQDCSADQKSSDIEQHDKILCQQQKVQEKPKGDSQIKIWYFSPQFNSILIIHNIFQFIFMVICIIASILFYQCQKSFQLIEEYIIDLVVCNFGVVISLMNALYLASALIYLRNEASIEIANYSKFFEVARQKNLLLTDTQMKQLNSKVVEKGSRINSSSNLSYSLYICKQCMKRLYESNSIFSYLNMFSSNMNIILTYTCVASYITSIHSQAKTLYLIYFISGFIIQVNKHFYLLRSLLSLPSYIISVFEQKYREQSLIQQLVFSRKLSILNQNEGTNSSCQICLSPFTQNEETVQLPCSEKHIFHKDCIKQWMLSSDSCPQCRYVLYNCQLKQIISS